MGRRLGSLVGTIIPNVHSQRLLGGSTNCQSEFETGGLTLIVCPLLLDLGTSSATLLTALVFPGDQLAVPSRDRLRRDEGGQPVFCPRLEGDTSLLDREDLPAREASDEGLDVAARNQAFDLAIGECRVRERDRGFDLGPQEHEAVEPPACACSGDQIGFAEQAKQYPAWPKIGPQLGH